MLLQIVTTQHGLQLSMRAGLIATLQRPPEGLKHEGEYSPLLSEDYQVGRHLFEATCSSDSMIVDEFVSVSFGAVIGQWVCSSRPFFGSSRPFVFAHV